MQMEDKKHGQKNSLLCANKAVFTHFPFHLSRSEHSNSLLIILHIQQKWKSILLSAIFSFELLRN